MCADAEPSAFTPARLSPRPAAARPGALPYGLTWAEFGSCLPGYDGGAATARRTHVLAGLRDEAASQIITADYVDVAGRRRTVPVFVKRCGSHGREADKHRTLASRGVRTPRLLGVVPRDGAQLIVLEFLPTVGIEPAGADELLDLIATLHCVDEPPAPLFAADPGLPQDEFERRLGGALRIVAARAHTQVDPTAWLRVYRRLRAQVSESPVELNHGELYFQQIGRRAAEQGGELVLFDFESTALLPRFTDVASILAGLSALTGRSERSLFEHYLAARRRRTGVGLDATVAWQDFLRVRVVTSFESLPWLIDVDESPSVPDTAATVLARIAADVRQLATTL